MINWDHRRETDLPIAVHGGLLPIRVTQPRPDLLRVMDAALRSIRLTSALAGTFSREGCLAHTSTGIDTALQRDRDWCTVGPLAAHTRQWRPS